MNLNHAGNHIAMRKRVVDTVMPLGDTVAHIGDKVSGSLATAGIYAIDSLAHQLVQMCAAGMAVSKGAFHENLGFCQILHRPAHADFQRNGDHSRNRAADGAAPCSLRTLHIGDVVEHLQSVRRRSR